MESRFARSKVGASFCILVIYYSPPINNNILILNMNSSLKLTTQTPLGKEELKKIGTILQNLFDNNDSYEFRQPVDWKGMALSDYPIIIKNPIDLGTVRKKLMNNKYQCVEEILDDIQLVWDNCKLYNSAGSWIHALADKLDKSSKKMFKNYLPNIQIYIPGKIGGQLTRDSGRGSQGDHEADIQPIETEEVTYQQKVRFSQRVKTLSQQDLARVVGMIQSLSPEAFKELQGGKSQILVDNLDIETFQKINEKIDQFTEGFQLNKKLKI